MFEKTGAEIMVGILERQGVRQVSGIPGGANLPLYDALGASGSISHVLARHEQGAGFIAQGMARVTGTPQVCLATSGPGAMNLLTAVADAKLDSIPLVCITGQVPSSMIGTDAFQEVDTYGLTIPITKHNFLARTPGELLTVLPEAFRIAASDRPGPVLVDVPKDAQTGTVRFERWPDKAVAGPMPRPDKDELRKAADMINAARRPVLYLGGGAASPRGAASAQYLAHKGSIPGVMTLMGLGILPLQHFLSLGLLGMHGAPCANLLMEEADLIIAAGVRFDDRATGKLDAFCPDADVVHIDIDPGEIDKLKRAKAGLVGDAGDVLADLAGLVRPAPRMEWMARVAELKSNHPLAMDRAENPGSPYGLILAAARILGPESITVTDVGQHQMWTAQAHPFLAPRRWLTSGGLGTMGFGLPSAIGAALAAPDTPVLLVSGDGSLRMNIQELETLAVAGANVKILLMNNGCLGLVRQQQKLFYEGRDFASDFGRGIDFIALARGFGIPAVDLGKSSDPGPALAKALTMDGPCLINAPVDPDEMVYPMVPPGAANTEMIKGEPHAEACA